MARPAGQAEVLHIWAEEAKRLHDSGAAIIVDVRKPEHFLKLRIAGAVSIPLKGPAARFWDLPTDRDIIIY